METILELCNHKQYWMAQIFMASEIITPEDIGQTLSGGGGFLILIAGLLLAFAFQLLLTNFFVALGISYSDSENQSDADYINQASDMDDKIDRVGIIVGLRALGTFSITLFIACFLAVKLCPVHDELLGAILGLIIWAGYFSLLVWISATTVGSVLGAFVDKATSGLQGIIGTATVAFSAKTISDRVVSGADAAATTVRNELSSSVDRASTRKAIDNYLNQLQLSESEREEIKDEFEKLVAEPEMQSLAKDNHLRNIGRKTFVDVVDSRTNFSKQDINLFLEQWEGFWQQLWQQEPNKALDVGALAQIVPVQLEEPEPNQLSPKLEQLIEQTRKQQAKEQAEAAQKVAETAAWWLFGTAFTSAAASAIAGFLSVRV